ncbi:MAG: 3'-5' exonuclease [Acidobacteriota bacterium]
MIDLETTGVNPLVDEILEIGAVLVTPGRRPKLVLDTLVKPRGPVRAQHVHGITDADVAEAPQLEDLLGPIESLLANRVLVAHNATFERRFLLRGPLRGLLPREVPHLCTLRLDHALHRQRRALGTACLDLGLPTRDRHTAADDALMAADLLQRLLKDARGVKKRRSSDIQHVGGCDLNIPPLPAPPRLVGPTSGLQHSRQQRSRRRRRSREKDYFDLVLSTLEDLTVDPHELHAVKAAQRDLAWPAVRAIHARIFEGVLVRYAEDRQIDERETENLGRVWRSLEQLGWAPGGPPQNAGAAMPQANSEPLPPRP